MHPLRDTARLLLWETSARAAVCVVSSHLQDKRGFSCRVRSRDLQPQVVTHHRFGTSRDQVIAARCLYPAGDQSPLSVSLVSGCAGASIPFDVPFDEDIPNPLPWVTSPPGSLGRGSSCTSRATGTFGSSFRELSHHGRVRRCVGSDGRGSEAQTWRWQRSSPTARISAARLTPAWGKPLSNLKSLCRKILSSSSPCATRSLPYTWEVNLYIRDCDVLENGPGESSAPKQTSKGRPQHPASHRSELTTRKAAPFTVPQFLRAHMETATGTLGAFLSSSQHHSRVPQGRRGICSRQMLKSSPDIPTCRLGAAGISPGVIPATEAHLAGFGGDQLLSPGISEGKTLHQPNPNPASGEEQTQLQRWRVQKCRLQDGWCKAEMVVAVLRGKWTTSVEKKTAEGSWNAKQLGCALVNEKAETGNNC
ncbi:hypothetical protein Anapl_00572 [Anas platyrhynchos]|uniref:Uncharacterized protein n=1 Tax=Anas platyrhynchos TaxID=8839 RepID=R0LJU1_ANAPL|nr:hypothetical protein Anapl_00572 [Anas platyrhynchos]